MRLGGLGIRSAVEVASSAYLASTAASVDLAHCIVPPHLLDIPLSNQDDAKTLRSRDHNPLPPEGVAQQHQKSWDNIRDSSITDALLETAPDSRARARLLASSARESGVWLNALPISSLGLHMDDDTIRVAVGLRLEPPCAGPTGAITVVCMEVDALTTHGLSYR